MTKELKEILIQIAALAKTDQRWILSKLPEKQRDIFQQRGGEQQLKIAHRFRQMKIKPRPLKLAPPKAVAYPQALANHPPLYIAIILEQGQFSWQESFLQQHDQDGVLKTLMCNQVQELKQSAKQALFTQWEAESSYFPSPQAWGEDPRRTDEELPLQSPYAEQNHD